MCLWGWGWWLGGLVIRACYHSLPYPSLVFFLKICLLTKSGGAKVRRFGHQYSMDGDVGSVFGQMFCYFGVKLQSPLIPLVLDI